MRKLISLAAASFALAAPALAGTMTLEFAPAEGDAITVTLSDDGTYTMGEMTGTYTWNEDTLTLCGTLDVDGAEEVCATMDEANPAPAVGDTGGYTGADGSAGTVTVKALSE